MPVPAPEPGLVISHTYLWRHEHQAGQEEGRKNRPCVIVLCVEHQVETATVTVAPIMHNLPEDAAAGIEIPSRVKRHLGLDSENSWVIVSEVNLFVWPGFDLRPVPGSTDKFDYGFLPPKLLEKIKSAMLDLVVKRRTRITMRD